MLRTEIYFIFRQINDAQGCSAHRYVNKIRYRFKGTDVYNQFLSIFKQYERGDIELNVVKSQVYFLLLN